MILAYEPFLTGLEHLGFNSMFLEIVSKCFSDDEIVFYAEKGHVAEITKLNKYSNVHFEELDVVPADNKIKALVKEFKNEKYLAKKYKNRVDRIIIFNSHPHTMYFAKRFFGNRKISFVVHGSLEEILKKKHIWQVGYYNKFAFNYKNNSNYQYIVLGDSIRKNALEYLPFIAEQLVAIPHPIFSNSYENKERTTNDKLQIGTIGTGSLEKHSELLFELEKILEENKIRNIELYHIGGYLNIIPPENTSVIVCGGVKEKLSQEEYTKRINDLDMLLFFFDKNSYKLTASGALADAINFKKPIIAIKNDYFQNIFDTVGRFGYLVEDFDELVKIVLDLSKDDHKIDYEEMEKNLSYAQQYFSPDNIVQQIKEKKIW